MKARKIPLRKCTGCNEMKNKKELIRVVHNENNEFFVDRTGRAQGRGAYVCPNLDCFSRSFKQKGLERSFKAAVSQEVYEQLKTEVEKL